MTDHALPGPQVSARWRSGSTTIATSGGAFVYGRRWGSLNGTLAVATLERGDRVKNARLGRLRGHRAPSRRSRGNVHRGGTGPANSTGLVGVRGVR